MFKAAIKQILLATVLLVATQASHGEEGPQLSGVNQEALKADLDTIEAQLAPKTQQILEENATKDHDSMMSNIDAEAGEGGSGATPSCEQAASKAKSTCNPFAAAGLEDGSSAIIEAALTNQITQSLSTSCKAAKNVSMVMGAISAGRAVMCKTAQSSCIKTCEGTEKVATTNQDTSKASADRRMISRCQGYEGPFMMQVMQTLAYTASILGSSSCKNAAEGGGVNPGTMPTPPNFAVNCDDPTQKTTNQVCICKANPQNSACNPFGSNGSRGLASGAGGRGDGSFGSMADGGGDGGGDDTLLGPPTGSDAGNSPNKVAEIGGGGGGGPQGAGGGGSGSGSGGNGAGGSDAGSGFNTDMASGGGGAGGGFAGYGRAKGDDDGGGSSALDKLKGMFNIKDALPDKDKLAKGLAGMSKEAAADGITGAMGESLFQKATRQYKNQESRGSFVVPRR